MYLLYVIEIYQITLSKFYILGNVTFTSEPTIKNVNNNNLKKFSSEIYTIDENMIVSGNNFLIKNMTVIGNNISKVYNYRKKIFDLLII